MKRIILLMWCAIISTIGIYAQTDTAQVFPQKIFMKYKGKILLIKMEDNATARDFIKMLPLTINMEEYDNGVFKAELDTTLATDDKLVQNGSDNGELTYHPSTNELEFRTDNNFIQAKRELIGKVTGGIYQLRDVKESAEFTFELIP